jgi:23S rRNA (uracil1939-C5)-methyltransferase
MGSKVSICIDHFNRRGWGVGHSDHPGKVELIGTLPGDEVLAELHRKRRGKSRGTVSEIVAPSSLRVQPRCPHVPHCGGCTWQQMDYSFQLEEKERRVKAAFAELIDAHTPECNPIIPCDEPWGYRNKMEFSFSQNRAGERFLGLVLAGSKGHVLNLKECHLVSDWFMPLLKHVRVWWEESGLAAYGMNDTGTLRTLIVREGKRSGDKLVMLTVSGNPAFPLSKIELTRFIDAVKASVRQEEWARLSIFLRVQQILKGSPTQFFEMHLHGPDHLLEKMQIGNAPPKELVFKISPTSFFQPNTFQAEKLYSEALKMVSFPKKHVLDLYAGTATLGIAMAIQAEKVTAIEINPHACFDAESNKELNHLSNLEILCGDVGKKLEEIRKRPDFVPPDLIVVDPPRTGLDSVALDQLKSLRPKEILYVSCNYETQAANVQEICKAGYRLAKMQPLDQFPHTPHIENICLLDFSEVFGQPRESFTFK